MDHMNEQYDWTEYRTSPMHTPVRYRPLRCVSLSLSLSLSLQHMSLTDTSVPFKKFKGVEGMRDKLEVVRSKT